MALESSPSQRAEYLLYSVFEAAENGCHVLTVSTGGPAVVVWFHNEGRRTYIGGGADMKDVVRVVAADFHSEVCGVFLRSRENEQAEDRAWGWRVRGTVATPLTAEEVRAACCGEGPTGEPCQPVEGQYYDDAPHINLT
ncbi:hypothetical protein [Streptomyces sp. NPDC085665]|uniref:hypothetical protein n=1 Tax=Streptomyces sp. NPDC085665 TaxID=3365735 RepID=UPI0037D6BF40